MEKVTLTHNPELKALIIEKKDLLKAMKELLTQKLNEQQNGN